MRGARAEPRSEKARWHQSQHSGDRNESHGKWRQARLIPAGRHVSERSRDGNHHVMIMFDRMPPPIPISDADKPMVNP